jgi:plasmid stabilization system protein ParE
MGKKTRTVETTYQVVISPNAITNINEITGYIAFINQQPLNAIKVGDAIFQAIDKIGERPYIFKECELIPTKNKIYRQARCLSWYIIYKIRNNQIKILGVIHSSRKPSKIKLLRKVK